MPVTPEKIDEIVERIVEAVHPHRIERALANIRAARGIWSDRDDIGTADEYVRNLRKHTAERLKKMGIWSDDGTDLRLM